MYIHEETAMNYIWIYVRMMVSGMIFFIRYRFKRHYV